MKGLTVLFILLVSIINVNAQTSGSASQTTNLVLANAIDISLVSSGTVVLAFNTVNDYANGVESDDYTLLVKSNKKFNVRVKANVSRFTYAGSTLPVPKMSTSLLKIKVTANNTGGTISAGYTNYKALSTTSRKIIDQGKPGGNNTFSVKYQAVPGFNYPAGNYTVDIIYTATQA